MRLMLRKWNKLLASVSLLPNNRLEKPLIKLSMNLRNRLMLKSITILSTSLLQELLRWSHGQIRSKFLNSSMRRSLLYSDLVRLVVKEKISCPKKKRKIKKSPRQKKRSFKILLT